LHQVGDLFELIVKLRCQNVKPHSNARIPYNCWMLNLLVHHVTSGL